MRSLIYVQKFKPMMSVALGRKKTKTWRLCRRVCPKVQFDRKCAVVLVYAALTAVLQQCSATPQTSLWRGNGNGGKGKGEG